MVRKESSAYMVPTQYRAEVAARKPSWPKAQHALATTEPGKMLAAQLYRHYIEAQIPEPNSQTRGPNIHPLYYKQWQSILSL